MAVQQNVEHRSLSGKVSYTARNGGHLRATQFAMGGGFEILVTVSFFERTVSRCKTSNTQISPHCVPRKERDFHFIFHD